MKIIGSVTTGNVRATRTPSKVKVGSHQEDQQQGYGGNAKFSGCANEERPPALTRQLAEVGAETDTGEGQQEGPAREVSEVLDLCGCEDVQRGKQREQKEAKHELGKLRPQKAR